MKFVISPASPPTHGPARRPPSTVPIESRNRGSFSVLARAWPAQSMAIQTGIRTIASVLSRNLNALSTPKVIPSWSLVDEAVTLLLRAVGCGRGHRQHGPGRPGRAASATGGHGAGRAAPHHSRRQGREPRGGRGAERGAHGPSFA